MSYRERGRSPTPDTPVDEIIGGIWFPGVSTAAVYDRLRRGHPMTTNPEPPAADAVAAARGNAMRLGEVLYYGVTVDTLSAFHNAVDALIAAAQVEAPRVAELEAALRVARDELESVYQLSSGLPVKLARINDGASRAIDDLIRALAPSPEGGE